eukprot:g41516.t1
MDGPIYSRIDFLLVSHMFSVRSANVKVVFFADHCLRLADCHLKDDLQGNVEAEHWWERVNGNFKRFFMFKGIRNVRDRREKLSKFPKSRQSLLPLQLMGVDGDLQEVKSQQASLFASEALKIIFRSRICTVEQDAVCSCFFFQKRGLPVTAVLYYYILWKRLDQPLRLNELTKTLEFFEKNKLPEVTACQLRATSESLALLRDPIAYVHDNGVHTCLISMDHEKAFDRISHKHMWGGLSKICNWIRLLKVAGYVACTKTWEVHVAKVSQTKGVHSVSLHIQIYPKEHNTE